MLPPTKSGLEMAHGRTLLRHLKIEAELVPGKVPAPDLIFVHEGKKIGIEHTRIFAEEGAKAGSFQAYEQRIDVLAEKCCAEYVKRGLPPIEAKIHLSHEIF